MIKTLFDLFTYFELALFAIATIGVIYDYCRNTFSPRPSVSYI